MRSGRIRVPSVPRGGPSTTRSGRFRVPSVPRGGTLHHEVWEIPGLLSSPGGGPSTTRSGRFRVPSDLRGEPSTTRSGKIRVSSVPRGGPSTTRSGRFRVPSDLRGEASGHVGVGLRRLLQDLHQQGGLLPGILALQGGGRWEVLVAHNTERTRQGYCLSPAPHTVSPAPYHSSTHS